MLRKNFTPSFKMVALGVATSLLWASCSKSPLEDTTIANDETIATNNLDKGLSLSKDAFVPNELLVKFKAGASASVKEKVLLKITGKVKEKVLTKAMQRNGDNDGFVVVNTPLAVLEAKSKLTGEEIEYAEPNYIYQHDAVSNDLYFTNGSLWGMYGDASSPANQFGSQAAEAWALNRTGSSSVFIGVIDEGAMVSHTDLAANFWTNPFDPIDGVDNDGNGYIDDVNGWDFDGNNNSLFDGVGDDHGTHVAGTIGAKGGNGTGVAGVVWNVKMIATKFLGRNGGTTSNAIKAIDYLTDLKVRHGLNLPATNNSWGGGGFSQALKDAIDRAGAQNILFVAAAGNDGLSNDVTTRYPSGYTSENIIAVASITNNGSISSFSNFGANSVDLGAPGSGIISTVPVSSKGKIASGYASYNGTSMATPHVSGAVALYVSSNPTATAAQIKNAILSTTVPTASLNGKTVTGGRLNVSSF